ncbi:MAG: HAMP domain-containing histidine kinase [Candidatus Thorarchaeota archaeon]|nr:HAMP domain-containing histidine kinase [Candidatus Thorarchaeota archaeon]
MFGLFHLALHVLVYSGAGLILYLLRRRLSLIPFYIYLGILQVFTSLMSSLYVLDLVWGTSVGGGSIAYAATIWAVMLLYIMEQDLEAIKMVILGISAIQFVFLILYPYYGFLLGYVGCRNPLMIPSAVFDVSFGIFWVGNLLALIEMVLMIFSIEKMKEIFSGVPSVIHVVVVYIGIMLIDAVLYPLFAFPVTQSISIVQGIASIISKIFLGLSYGGMLLFAAITLKSPYVKKEGEKHLTFSDMLALPKTDVIRAWQQAEENQNQVRLLLDIISHDIRNYSNNSLSIVQLLKMKYPDLNEDVMDLLDKLQRMEQQSIALLENALNLGRLRGALLQVENIDIYSHYEDAKSHVRESYPSLSFRFPGEDSLEGLSVECNGLLKLAFYNLLSNMAKYREPDSKEVRIDIDTQVDDESVEVTFADHGVGMTEEQKNKAFDSLDKRPRHQHFGLFLVKSILEQSGCSIRITNRADAPNDHTAGTAFHLSFPRA